jgi:hypothetical protein
MVRDASLDLHQPAAGALMFEFVDLNWAVSPFGAAIALEFAPAGLCVR